MLYIHSCGSIREESRSTNASVPSSPKFRPPKHIIKQSDGRCVSNSLASPSQHNGQKSEGLESVEISQQLSWVGEAKTQVKASLKLLREAGTRKPPVPCYSKKCAIEYYCSCVLLEKQGALDRALSTYQELVREGRDRDLLRLQQGKEPKTKNAAFIGLTQVISVPVCRSRTD